MNLTKCLCPIHLPREIAPSYQGKFQPWPPERCMSRRNLPPFRSCSHFPHSHRRKPKRIVRWWCRSSNENRGYNSYPSDNPADILQGYPLIREKKLFKFHKIKHLRVFRFRMPFPVFVYKCQSHIQDVLYRGTNPKCGRASVSIWHIFII